MTPMTPLTVLGLGPGDAALLTPQARHALERAQCLVGYDRYLDLISPELACGKERISSGMRRERERCDAAIDAALDGKLTVLVCSGDPGIYALAGLVLERLAARGLLEELPVTILPGVPALCAAAALLGAPLTHDFACISLSDLLTPWERIRQRLVAALSADFVCVIYNPRSHGRPRHLAEALRLASHSRHADCPVGIVRNAWRADQHVAVHRLADMTEERMAQVDMLTLLIVGNSQSRTLGRYMLTPRGYETRAEGPDAAPPSPAA